VLLVASSGLSTLFLQGYTPEEEDELSPDSTPAPDSGFPMDDAIGALEDESFKQNPIDFLQGSLLKIGPSVANGTPPVPTTAKCIVVMCITYMIIYIVLAACRTYHEFSGTAYGNLEAGLVAATQFLTYAPMLCVLFIACRMRVEFLSAGKGEPQLWVQTCMGGVTTSLVATTLLILGTTVYEGRPLITPRAHMSQTHRDIERPHLTDASQGGKCSFFFTSVVRYCLLGVFYGGIVGIILGIHIYLPPGATDASKLPAPAPAVACTMFLAALYFLTQLIIVGCRTMAEFKVDAFPKLVEMMQSAGRTVEYAPILAILFMAAQMRAQQHGANPQPWAQSCMLMATGAMSIATLLAALVPVVLGGQMTMSQHTGEVTFHVPDPTLGYIFVALRFACTLVFYGGAFGVIYAIFAFQAPYGITRPVSHTVQCVVNLACQFFFLYFILSIVNTAAEMTDMDLESHPFFAALEASKATLDFAPMLSVLFITTRMYALLITSNQGAPQAWVQDGMCMATWSLLISFLSCLCTGFFGKVVTDDDGNVVNKFSNQYLAIAMTVLRYFTMLLLYGGIAIVVGGLFTMTPATANGHGSLPFFSDAVNATPLGKPPMSLLEFLGRATRDAKVPLIETFGHY
jgi:hypothetical protein